MKELATELRNTENDIWPPAHHSFPGILKKYITVDVVTREPAGE